MKQNTLEQDLGPEDLEMLVKDEESRLGLEKEKLLDEIQKKLDDYICTGEEQIDFSDQMHNQYLFWRQTRKWLEIEGDSGLTSLSEILTLCKEKVPKLEKVKSIVDNGVGSGKKAAIAYKMFNPEQNEVKGRLHGIDVSPTMISNARRYWEQEGIAAPLHRPVAFEDLGRIARISNDDHYKLHLLLGQTIGNFGNPAEILERIMLNMNKGEYLLLEWFCREPKDYAKPEFEELYRDLFTIAGIPPQTIGGYKPRIEINGEGEWNIMPFTVQDIQEEKRTFTLLGKRYILQPKTEIVVSRSRRFKEEEVVKLCETVGLKGVGMKEWTEVECGPEHPYTTKFVRKWEPKGDRRYGLFQKWKEAGDDAKKMIIPLAALAAVAGYLVGQTPVIPCTNGVVDELKIRCTVEGRIETFPLYRIKKSKNRETSVEIETKEHGNFNVTFVNKSELQEFSKAWAVHQNLEWLVENAVDPRSPLQAEPENDDDSFLWYVANCTRDVPLLTDTWNLLHALTNERMSLTKSSIRNHLSRIASDRILFEGAVRIYKNPLVFDTLQKCERTGQAVGTIVEVISSLYFKGEQLIYDLMPLIKYYVDNNAFHGDEINKDELTSVITLTKFREPEVEMVSILTSTAEKLETEQWRDYVELAYELRANPKVTSIIRSLTQVLNGEGYVPSGRVVGEPYGRISIGSIAFTRTIFPVVRRYQHWDGIEKIAGEMSRISASAGFYPALFFANLLDTEYLYQKLQDAKLSEDYERCIREVSAFASAPRHSTPLKSELTDEFMKTNSICL